MIHLEDILDSATRYLRGEMTEEEAKSFDALLDENPHLKEELRFMKLVSLGLEDLEEEVEIDHKKEATKKRTLWMVSLAAASIVLFLLIYLNNQDALSSENSDAVLFQNKGLTIPINDSSGIEGAIAISQVGTDGNKRNSDRGHSVSWVNNSEIAFSGTFQGEGKIGDISFSSKGEDNDMLIGKYNITYQQFSWLMAVGGEESHDFARGICADSEENIIITGGFGGEVDFDGWNSNNAYAKAKGNDDWGNRDFFIAKYNNQAELVWVDNYGGNRVDDKQTGMNTGLSVIADKNDNIIASGAYIGEPKILGEKLPIGGPNEEVFIIKYSPNGQINWVKTILGDYMVIGHDLTSDIDGNIFITGMFGHHNLSGNIFFGEDSFPSFGGRDVFIAKYSPLGELLWVNTAGSDIDEQGHEGGRAITIDHSGNAIIAGQFLGTANFNDELITSYGGRDIFIAKYNSIGQILWTKNLGSVEGDGEKSETANGIVSDISGNIYVTGNFAGEARFGDFTIKTKGEHNFFISKLSPDGDVIWVKQFNQLSDFKYASGSDIDINERGELVITGYFSGTIEVGDKILKSQGMEDIFILVIDGEGRLLSLNSMVRIS